MKKSTFSMLAASVALATGGWMIGCDQGDDGGADGGSDTVAECRLTDDVKQSLGLACFGTDLAFKAAITDRLQTGFKNWNQGYEAWLKWCDTLYEPDAHYNVYGQRLTLEQYKGLMGQFFGKYDIRLGALDNVLIEGDWAAIRYTVYVTEKATGTESELKTMEFVNFKNNPEPAGARVIEGWAISGSQLTVQ